MELTCVSISIKDEFEIGNDSDLACTVELELKKDITGKTDEGKEWSLRVTKAHATVYLPKEHAAKFKLGEKYELETPI